MAGRYPDYDWRGIAMLTQQLGQLFEPSKAKLMSQQQEHEMNMLMAKKSWDMQHKELERLQKEFDMVSEQYETEKDKVEELGSKELVDAGTVFGATFDQSMEVLEKTGVRKVEDLLDTANDYRRMIRDRQTGIDNFEKFNLHAIWGKKWSDELTAKTTEERADIKGKDYKAEHDADKSGTLSWAEQNNALKDYIRDYYAVPEGEQGMDINIGDETLQATPEAHAFVAGFRHVRGRKGVDAAEIDIQAKIKKPDALINQMTMAMNTIQEFELKGLNKQKIGMRKGGAPPGFTSLQVDELVASHNMYKTAWTAYAKLGLDMPEELANYAPVLPTMFDDEERWGAIPDKPKGFVKEGLTHDVYIKIDSSTGEGTDTHKKMAYNIVYNWDDIMKSGSQTEINNMLASLNKLKQAYKF